MTGLILKTERLLLRDFVNRMTTCDVHNHASARVLTKIGMRQDGTLRHDALLRDGTWRDHFVFGILTDERRAIR